MHHIRAVLGIRGKQTNFTRIGLGSGRVHIGQRAKGPFLFNALVGWQLAVAAAERFRIELVVAGNECRRVSGNWWREDVLADNRNSL